MSSKTVTEVFRAYNLSLLVRGSQQLDTTEFNKWTGDIAWAAWRLLGPIVVSVFVQQKQFAFWLPAWPSCSPHSWKLCIVCKPRCGAHSQTELIKNHTNNDYIPGWLLDTVFLLTALWSTLIDLLALNFTSRPLLKVGGRELVSVLLRGSGEVVMLNLKENLILL